MKKKMSMRASLLWKAQAKTGYSLAYLSRLTDNVLMKMIIFGKDYKKKK
jgi:hypothetical protein